MIIEAQITDKDEIEFYYNIFANRLNMPRLKEGNIPYSLILRFYNTGSKNIYI